MVEREGGRRKGGRERRGRVGGAREKRRNGDRAKEG